MQQVRYYLLFIFLINCLIGKALDTESSLKASLIYYFIQYVEWPNEDSIQSFNIAIYSPNSKVFDDLKNIAVNKKIKNKPILVAEIKSLSQLQNFHAIYIAKEYNGFVSTISSQIAKQSILLITDNYANKTEVMINFTYQEEGKKISFETNKQNLKDHGFNYKRELLIYGGSQLEVNELLNEADARLKKTLDQIKLYDQIIEQQKSELDARNKTVQDLENKLIVTDSNLRKQEAVFQELNNLIIAKQDILEKKTIEIKNQKEEKEKIIEEIKIKKQDLSEALDSLRYLETELTDKQIMIKKQRKALFDKEIRIERQHVQILFTIVLLTSLLVLLFLFIWLYRIKRNLNIKLENKVKERTHQLSLSESHFVNLFKNSPVATIEFDFSEVYQHLKALKLEKKEDLDEYFSNDQSKEICIKKVKLQDINSEVFNLFQIEKESEIFNNYFFSYNKEAGNDLIRVIKAFSNGEVQIEYEAQRLTTKGDLRYVIIRWVAIDNTFTHSKNVLVTLSDITRLKEYENELQQHRNNLEELVKIRTAEIINLNTKLSAINEELKASNDQLIEKKDELENALLKIKETQTTLIQSEKMASLGMLTAGIAHEINNPLNFISGSRQLIELIISDLNQIKPDELNHDHFINLYDQLQIINRSIETGVDRTLEIISGLKNYLSNESDTFSEVNLIEVSKNTQLILRNKYKDRIEIKEQYDDNLIIECIPGKIYQVFTNLLANAIDAIPDKGTIEINMRLNNDTDQVIITIKDTGIGINEESLKSIFDPFYTTKAPGKGTGLGLFIVFGIINLHKGKIEVDSNVSQGSIFTINLPLHQTDKSNILS